MRILVRGEEKILRSRIYKSMVLWEATETEITQKEPWGDLYKSNPAYR